MTVPAQRVRHVTSFEALRTTPFAGDVNALCWERTLPGDYAEVIARLGPGSGIVAIEDARLAERLRTMKSAVDNKPPQQFSHIGGNNSKKLSADKGTPGAAARGAACARARSRPNSPGPQLPA